MIMVIMDKECREYHHGSNKTNGSYSLPNDCNISSFSNSTWKSNLNETEKELLDFEKELDEIFASDNIIISKVSFNTAQKFAELELDYVKVAWVNYSDEGEVNFYWVEDTISLFITFTDDEKIIWSFIDDNTENNCNGNISLNDKNKVILKQKIGLFSQCIILIKTS